MSGTHGDKDMKKYYSDLERLWLRRAAIEACIEVLHKYEDLRNETEYRTDDYMDPDRVDEGGDCIMSPDDHQREYEQQWSFLVSEEDRRFEDRDGDTCGSIERIRCSADQLVEAIQAARERGCESSLYGIRRNTLS